MYLQSTCVRTAQIEDSLRRTNHSTFSRPDYNSFVIGSNPKRFSKIAKIGRNFETTQVDWSQI